ncbi:HtaA domain-containing protein [Conexibacter sp. JD483]|uniref:HtaA domain-containing protein n=1 Tax=unclassified Conexibacter TaxID=2627773 RepID=UPI00271C20B1|nr:MULTISPECIES: HtaA domain-containing protein [unclassified Conexibacter]MDO8185424.1 HtaA domain-containing protein [Conexibacter sp. CPCC 205706]MDO8198400.1 HtaA domain-containing protein [Conexibacter sp. CPCC 205762]MDR9369362.1 HtaA domain-containing protein [Conexibacter sp. JD483]
MILSRPRALGAVVALAALPAVALPAAAQAASGATTIQLKGSAATALTGQVKLSAKKPAKASARSLYLPVSGGSVASGATLRNGGSVTLKAGKRSVTLTSWQTRVATTGSQVSAKLGSRRVTFFTITAPKKRIAVNKATKAASLAGGSARLTAAGAKALRTRLALRRLAAGSFGTAKVTAKLGGGTTGGNNNGGGTTTPGGGGTTTPTPGGTPTTPTTPRQCEGFSTGNVPAASAPLARAADALNVASAPMHWYARDSWVRYISTARILVSDGAVAGPVETYPEPTESYRDPSRSVRLSYGVDFAFDASRSWYAPSSNTGVLYYTGTVRYLWDAHGIDLTFKNPEVELNGANSRLVFEVSGAACSNFAAKRVSVLKLTSVTPTAAAPLYSFAPLAARITTDGASLFSNMYYENDPWGSVRDLAITTTG